MKTIHVEASSGYDIIINTDGLQQLGEYMRRTLPATKKVLAVTDAAVNALYSDTVLESLRKSGFCTALHVIENCCEKTKTLDTVEKIYESAERESLTRSDAILALGGGIVGDIAGFAASSYMRGIKFVQVPTTIIAQTDSSVGGKCGVNYRNIKNLIGAFYSPALVYTDTSLLRTLPDREKSAGMAEVIKYACISDRLLFSELKSGLYEMQDIVSRCVSIKRDITEKDEHDMGLRHILNFGHTVGHALEECSHNELLHGEGVAMGMYAMARCGEKLSITKSGTAEQIHDLCSQFSLCADIPSHLNYIDFLSSDKKRTGDSIMAVFITEIGKSVIRNIKIHELAELLNG